MVRGAITFLTKDENVSKEDREIIAYGFECILSKAINILSLLPAVIWLGMFKEWLIFLVLFGILRPLAGGYHAETKLRCLIISDMLIVLALMGIRVFYSCDFDKMRGLLVIFVMAAEGIIYRLIPVDTENKRLDEAEKAYNKNKCVCWLVLMDICFVICMHLELLIYVFVMEWVLLCLLLLLAAGVMKNYYKS